MQAVNKVIIKGRVAGPFMLPPLPNIRLSHVGMLLKLKAHMDSFITKSLCSFKYSYSDEALCILANLGPGTHILKFLLLARLDIEIAIRLLPIHMSDFELGFKIQDMILIDKSLQYDCTVSYAKFEKFSTFLEWIIRDRSSCDNIVH